MLAMALERAESGTSDDTSAQLQSTVYKVDHSRSVHPACVRGVGAVGIC